MIHCFMLPHVTYYFITRWDQYYSYHLLYQKCQLHLNIFSALVLLCVTLLQHCILYNQIKNFQVYLIFYKTQDNIFHLIWQACHWLYYISALYAYIQHINNTGVVYMSICVTRGHSSPNDESWIENTILFHLIGFKSLFWFYNFVPACSITAACSQGVHALKDLL